MRKPPLINYARRGDIHRTRRERSAAGLAIALVCRFFPPVDGGAVRCSLSHAGSRAQTFILDCRYLGIGGAA